MNAQLGLLAFDTDRIKDYVFATDTLKEIRGASARLDDLNRRTMPDLVRQVDPTAQTIYARGGAGLFVVDAAKADEARLAVERAYRKHTGSAASVTGAAVELPPGFDRERGNVRDLIKLLQLRLRRAKDRPPPALAVTSLPPLRPCDACGEFPATRREERDPTRLICPACRLRQEGAGGLWEHLIAGLPFTGNRPEDFNALGALSKPQGYLGLLYADGNGMGREIEKLETLPQTHNFAEGVDRAIFNAAREAIQAHLPPKHGTLPFDTLLLGGDDLVMVTQAQSAMDVAITLVEKFGEHTKAETGQRLSLSVGVVLAHAHFPFRTMLDLAESALKFAKREAVKRGLDDRSLINFLTITSANHLDFKKFYAEALKHEPVQPSPQGSKWLRSLRPYAPADLRHLLNVARDLRGAPRGKLHALGECVFLSHNQSVLEGLTTLHRWRGGAESGEKARQVNAIVELVNWARDGQTVFPWRGDHSEWRTPLLDLVELLDFARGG